MEFSIKKYYNIENEVTNKEVVEIFLKDLEENFPSFKEMLLNIKENQEFIYPQDSYLMAKKIKYWTAIVCIFLEKITANPIFILNGETFIKNERICTIDAFSFFLSIFNEKIGNEVFNKEIIDSYIDLINEYKDTTYNVCIEQLLRIDAKEPRAITNEKLVNFIIK